MYILCVDLCKSLNYYLSGRRDMWFTLFELERSQKETTSSKTKFNPVYELKIYVLLNPVFNHLGNLRVRYFQQGFTPVLFDYCPEVGRKTSTTFQGILIRFSPRLIRGFCVSSCRPSP